MITLLRRALIATSLGLLFTATADAAFYSGRLDPASDGFVPAYNGYASFTVADPGCTNTGFNDTSNGNLSGSCGVATVDSVTIFLYGNAGPPTPSQPGLPAGNGALDTLSLAFPSEPINELFFGAGKTLLAIDTNPMLLTGNTFYPGTFWLDYDIGSVPSFTSLFVPIFPTATLLYDPQCAEDCFSGNAPGALQAVATFCPGLACLPGTVPEPSGPALLLAAAVAALAARRRKQTVSPNLPAESPSA